MKDRCLAVSHLEAVEALLSLDLRAAVQRGAIFSGRSKCVLDDMDVGE